MKKHYKLLSVLILAVILGSLIYKIYFALPQFFPLNNPQGSYKITTGCPWEESWQETNISGNITKAGYCVEYRGDNIFISSNKGKTHFYRITVGTSRQDLQPFLNKEVI